MSVHPQFEPVQSIFDTALSSGEELGVRFTVVRQGEVVLDLWGGHADREKTRPFDNRTLTPVFSVTKALAAILVARLADQGKLAYGQTVASVWPEFAAAGKAAITVEQMLSHQAGLPGFLEPMAPSDWFDWNLICGKLAAMTPLWPPGTASGYHAVTYGYLAGEVFRRVDGRTMGRALAEDIAGPLGLDLFIGLPESEDERVASLQRPSAFPKFGKMNDAVKAAFLTKWASPGGRGAEAWRRAEIPSANGHATALALATLMDVMANGGGDLLSPSSAEALARQRIVGDDLVLPFHISWGAGVMRNQELNLYGPGQETFGHSGWGGACCLADPERGLGMAYVMNKQSSDLIGDARARRLIDAAYACF
jgi:CubicO group peptidase (beta-lactamase class C family)